MLDELHVSDIALIHEAELGFAAGLTVLTGETGAGKTALLNALALITGQRASASVVRDGCDEARAEARIIEGGRERIIRRRLSASGRSRCSIDGSMSTVAELSEATAQISIHGQHEQVALLKPRMQAAYLDAHVPSIEALIDTYTHAREVWLSATAALAALHEARDESTSQLEYQRFVLAQIDEIDPQEGEEESLRAQLPRLQSADELASSIDEALDALQGEGKTLDAFAQALSALSNVSGIDDELDELAESFSSILATLEDGSRDLGAYRRGVDADPRSLQECLSRLDALSGLMKRFGPDMEEVFAKRRAAQEAIAAAEASPASLEEAEAREEKARLDYEAAAEALHEARETAAPKLCERLAEAVSDLSMEGATFSYSFTPLDFSAWTAYGSDTIELLYSPSVSSSLRPLSRIASGGELSRILLALECVGVSGDSSARTIVFDEVDQGIGGATGAAVARRLSQLSRSAQVIVVTHLPQVAAIADRHLLVSKSTGEDKSVSTGVESVTGEARVIEIARMLAGSVDEVALAHARTLLGGGEVKA